MEPIPIHDRPPHGTIYLEGIVATATICVASVAVLTGDGFLHLQISSSFMKETYKAASYF